MTLCILFVFSTRWQTAITATDWVPSVLVRFDDLCFIVTIEGGLERIFLPDCFSNTTIFDLVVDTPRGPRLGPPWADAPELAQHLLASHGGEEQQQRLQEQSPIEAFRDNQPSLDSQRRELSPVVSTAMPLRKRESTPPGDVVGHALMVSPFAPCNVTQEA